MNDEKIFVYEGLEVKLTSRKANRTLKNNKIDEIYEITPANSEQGTWKKWIRKPDLYEIE